MYPLVSDTNGLFSATLCLIKKVPTFKLSVTSSNLNRFSYTPEKRRKFATKIYDVTRLTLGTLLHYLGKLKIQIFCRYSADMEENANKLHLCTDSNSSMHVTVLVCVC